MDLREIVHRVGGSVTSGGARATVPGPGHSRDDRSLSLYLSGDRVVWHSFANDPPEAIRNHLGISAVAESELSKSERAKARKARVEWEISDRWRKQQFCRDLWSRAIPATGTPAHDYLRARAIPAATLPGALRYLAEAPRGYEKSSTSPAMLALVIDRHGAPSGLHVTYIKGHRNDGRIMVGSIMGGAVRLYSPTDELAVCEGIETALSYAAIKSIPTWAVLSTSGLAAFSAPIEIDRLTLAIDSDDTSKAHPLGAAYEIATAKICPWCEITIDAAPDACDWNDVLQAQAG